MTGLQGDLFPDLPEGQRRRDAGIAQVSDNNAEWLERCYAEADRFIAGRREFTGEDIRFHCADTVGHPAHHNAWGALINQLVRAGKIVHTGRLRPMRARDSHARLTPIYRPGAVVGADRRL